MSYESGSLVRRHQREYPPVLRQEIALSAIELGNNREVARLYSLKLGYSVNESTIRGIKKRYLEGIQKGKIAAPAGLILNCFSPRSSTLDGSRSVNEGRSSHEGSVSEDHYSQEGEEEEDEGEDEDFEGYYVRGEEDTDQILPESVMKLQLEILEGRMKEETLDRCELSSNGDMDDSNPLSIDTEADENRPTIRINKGIQSQASSALKRKGGSELNGSSPVVRKVRPTHTENEADISTLEKEIRALHWLARRKEQEWDQVIRLLKQKEEKLMQAQRTRTLIRTDSEHVLSRALILPKRNTMLISTPNVRQQNLEITEEKISSALQKATANLEKEGGGGKEKTPVCQGCKSKKSEFVCAGCSNRWYCSRECQVEDWDDHADECSG